MLSGPRNILQLNRSWSSRDDTYVTDEPFYSYYLKKTKLKHPMYREIIVTIIRIIMKSLHNYKVPMRKKIWYQNTWHTTFLI